MSFTARLANSVVSQGSTIALVLALGSLPGIAQTSRQGAKPNQPEPKSQQAQTQNAAPLIVELKPEPAQPEWTKVCGRDQGANAEICYTTRDFVTGKGQRIVAVALYDTKGKAAQKTVRILVPLGFLVAPGIRIVVDKNRPIAGGFSACLPHGCFVEAAVKDDFVSAIKKGSTLNVSARNQVGKEITFAVPVAGFGKAFDGPPVDPQVLAEQQKKMQEDLQKRTEELRNRQMSNPGSPVEAPAPSSEVTEPKN
jgi:invasion protein IalB